MIFSMARIAATVMSAVALVACGPAPASIAPPPSSVALVSAVPETPTPISTPGSSASAAPSSVAVREWRPSAQMIRGRTGFDAVVLGDGSVLAVGDDFACYPGPAARAASGRNATTRSGTSWMEAPSLNKPRKEPATVVLSDGSALVVGGLNDVEQPFSSTKRFATGTGAWADGPLMTLGRVMPLG